jgi:Tfp pilus assembly protein PilF
LGLAFGFFSLTRENMLVAGLLLTAWPCFHSGVGTYGRRAAAAFLVLAGVAAPLLPVYARNVSFGARTSITTYQLGSNFYIGNHTGATGSYKPLLPTRGDTRFEEADARGIAERESGRPLTADGVSAFWLGKTFREIAADPMGWLNLMLRKCALAVNRIEKIDTDDIYFMEQHSLLLRLLNSFWNFGLLFPLAIAGMVAARSKWRELLIPILLLGVTMGSMIAFYVVARYRHGAAPILVLFAAVAAVRGFRAIHAERFGDLRLPVLGAATAGLLAWWPVTSKENQLATSYFNAAGILYKQGDPAGAAAFYRRALKSGFSEPSANVNLAVSLIGTGELSEARELLEAVLPNAPDKATVALNLGNIALREDRTSDALRLYSSARDMDSSSPEIANALGVALWRSGMSAEAQEMFDAAIALKPGYPAPYRNLASMSTAAGRNTEAIAILERGMKLAEEPATAEALRNLSIELRQHAVPSGTAATTATP